MYQPNTTTSAELFMVGRAGEQSMAKVAWSVITLPKGKGGLGIVDPVDQCRALLSKLIVRGFLPGTEIWKTLLRDRIAQCAPVVGQPWKKEVRWIFNKDQKIHCRRKWEDSFINGIWRAWSKIREGLFYSRYEGEEEFFRQPIIWNPRITMANGQMIGERSKLSWGPFAAGPASSFLQWCNFSRKLYSEQNRILKEFRGGRIMANEVFEYTSTFRLEEVTNQQQHWFGLFTSQGQLLVIINKCPQRGPLQFAVGEDGQLIRSTSEPFEEDDNHLHRVRLVAYSGTKWLCDPPLEKIEAHWKIWVQENRPLVRLQWDPGEYYWIDPFKQESEGKIPFFQYTVKLGRHILAGSKVACPAASCFWEQNGISTCFLEKFWKRLWARNQPRKIVTCQWLLAHRALPVGEWMRKIGKPSHCPLCGYQMECLVHRFWTCYQAVQVWRRLLRIIERRGVCCTISWGMVAWSTLSKEMNIYDNNHANHVFEVKEGFSTMCHGQGS